MLFIVSFCEKKYDLNPNNKGCDLDRKYEYFSEISGLRRPGVFNG